MVQEYTMELGGRPFSLETGKLAKQINGAVLVKYGDTRILVTAGASSSPREGIDFFPLMVDMEERNYAIGEIPGGIFRREGRPTEKAIIAARLTDRPLRPLFPDGFRNEVQIIMTILSLDYDHSEEICGMIGASAALAISDIPFDGPIGAVEVGYIDGEYIINPTSEQSNQSEMALIVAATKEAVVMVEASAVGLPEAVVLRGLTRAHEEIKRIVALQEEMAAEIGKEKIEVVLDVPGEDVVRAVRDFATAKMQAAIDTVEKLERQDRIKQVKEETLTALEDQFPEREKEIKRVLDTILKEEVRKGILDRGERPDGRGPTDIRDISCEVGLMPRVHGTGLFTRGQTQVLTAATLGKVSDVQRLIDLGEEESKRVMHHYNFPPYSVGETWFLRGPKRREIGHGFLAERALLPVIPSDEEFPYTLRLVSEVLESNGSSSMASVCGSSLALMDAGVPIKAPVAGIAMGLVKDKDKYKILTDIQGMEDHLGDMDFKVAGTREGVTAIQMDIKIEGVSSELFEEALEQARQARLHILDKMQETIAEPRPELSPYAPRIIILRVHPDKIREIIGPGGKVINKIIAECDVEIDIEDDGTVYIASIDQEGGQKAKEWVERIVEEPEPGRIYKGVVQRVTDFGAFVEILPGKDGLVHISKLADFHVNKVEDILKEGDEVMVKLTEIDHLGRINLSRAEALKEMNMEDPKKAEHGSSSSSPRPSNRDSGGSRGGRSGGGRGNRRR